MMHLRAFGTTDVCLSPITFGTMRFYAHRFNDFQASVDYLESLYEQGVNTYHTSAEYETHAFFCEAFLKFKASRKGLETKHVVKLACPHFEESDFSPTRLEALVDAQLKALNIEQIDVLQWLFRQKQNIDAVRIEKFEASIEEMLFAFSKLKQAGKIRALASFPYSLPFAKVVNDYAFVEGFVDYLNFAERQWVSPLETLTANKLGFLAIRPLFAGKLSRIDDEQRAKLMEFRHVFGLNTIEQLALAYPLLHPNVASVILSFSSEAHAKAAIEVGHAIPVNGNHAQFLAWTQQLDEICFSETSCVD